MKTPEQIRDAIEKQMLKEAGINPKRITYDFSAKSLLHRLVGDILASGSTYLMVEEGNAIMCLKCGMVSHNPNDVKNRYCGNCHEFLDLETQ